MKFSDFHCKMKCKLLIISLLPFIVLSLFIIYVISYALPYYKWAKIDRQVVKILSASSALSSDIINEQLLSAGYLDDRSSASVNSEIAIVRESVAEDFEHFRKEYLRIADISSSPKKPSNTMAALSDLIETLDDFRSSIDSGSASVEDLLNFYGNINDKLILVTEESLHDVNYIQFYHPMINLILLLKEQFAAVKELFLLSQSTSAREFSRDSFSALNKAIGEQVAYRNLFYVIGGSEEDKLIADTVINNNFHRAERARDRFIAAPNATPNLEEWRNLQKEKISSFNEAKTKLISRLSEEVRSYGEQVYLKFIYLIAFMTISIILAFVFMYFNLRAVTRKLESESDILSETGDQIIAYLTEASAGTAETATNVAETTSTVEELKQTSEIAARSAKNIAEISKSNLTTLAEVEQKLKRNMEGMRAIKEGMRSISKSIVQLSEQALTIKNIIDTVDDLAEQSHLLSINAAIEAAKAKEHGKGFGVVAQEIRNLAEQSKKATIQVRSILSEIKNSTNSAVLSTEQGTKTVDSGMEFSHEMEETVKNLSKNIVNAADISEQIEQSSEQQLTGVSQVTLSMSNIKEASNLHVLQIGEIEKALKKVHETSGNLKKMIDELAI